MIMITIGGVLLVFSLFSMSWLVAGAGIVFVVVGAIEIIFSS